MGRVRNRHRSTWEVALAFGLDEGLPRPQNAARLVISGCPAGEAAALALRPSFKLLQGKLP